MKKCFITLLMLSSFLLVYQLVSLRFHYIKEKLSSVINIQTKKSLDHCRDIFEIQSANPTYKSEWIQIAVDAIREAKSNRNFLAEEAYIILGNEGLSNIVERKDSQGINGTNITIPYNSLLDKLNWSIPYLPCKLKRYKAEDIKSCTEERFKKGKSTRIAYYGDSRIRYHMETLLDLLHMYQLDIYTAEGGIISLDDFLGLKGNSEWTKYKSKLNVSSPDLPGFFIEFAWAPNLHLGSKGKMFMNPARNTKLETNKTTSNNKDNKDNRNQNNGTITTKDNKMMNDGNISTEENKSNKDGKIFTEDDKNKNKRNNNNEDSMSNVNITAAKTPPNINIGAFDELQDKLEASDENIPDIILLDTGSWQLQRTGDALKNIDDMAVSGLRKLYYTLNGLANRVAVVMMLPEPFKEYMYSTKDSHQNYFTLQHNNNLEWYLNAQAQLIPKNVLVWDSFLPFSHAMLSDCMDIVGNRIDQNILKKYSIFSSEASFACTDRIHVGFRTVYIGVQQLLNHLCNDFVSKSSKNYCCVN